MSTLLTVLAAASLALTAPSVDPVTVTAHPMIDPCGSVKLIKVHAPAHHHVVHRHVVAKPATTAHVAKRHKMHRKVTHVSQQRQGCDAIEGGAGAKLDLSGLLPTPAAAPAAVALPEAQDAAAIVAANPIVETPQAITFPPQPDEGDSFIIGGPGAPGGGGGSTGPGGGGGGGGIVVNKPPLAGPVPEPASWAMMLAGFGLMGATIRRRRLAT